MTCKNCGAEFEEGVFCPVCGTEYGEVAIEEEVAENGIAVTATETITEGIVVIEKKDVKDKGINKKKKSVPQVLIIAVIGCLSLATTIMIFAGGKIKPVSIADTDENVDINEASHKGGIDNSEEYVSSDEILVVSEESVPSTVVEDTERSEPEQLLLKNDLKFYLGDILSNEDMGWKIRIAEVAIKKIPEDFALTVDEDYVTLCINLDIVNDGNKVLDIENSDFRVYIDDYEEQPIYKSEESRDLAQDSGITVNPGRKGYYRYEVAISENRLNQADDVEVELSNAVLVVKENGGWMFENDSIYIEISDDYIFPDSDRRFLTKDEIYALSKEEMRIARNEIYARLGRKFIDETLQDYFNSKNWYEPVYEADEFDTIGDSIFNEYEFYNKSLISEVESELKYR